MSLRILKPGILSTVQDLGRIGFAQLGINRSGAMDRSAMRMANMVVGNGQSDAVLEMHFPAAEIMFETDCVVALGGADFAAMLDGKPIENWRPFFCRKGAILAFDRKTAGNRIYLAVAGGLEADEWLGSRSTNLVACVGGYSGRKLMRGDQIVVKRDMSSQTIVPPVRVSNSLLPRYSAFPTVRVVAGAEFERLTMPARELLFGANFEISTKSDRMGFRLNGPPLNIVENREMVSSAVDFGTIQLLPDGQLIVLMADHQTSGGYPRIAHIIPTDLPLAAQLGAHDKVAFHQVELADAEQAVVTFERDLKVLRAACKFLSLS